MKDIDWGMAILVLFVAILLVVIIVKVSEKIVKCVVLFILLAVLYAAKSGIIPVETIGADPIIGKQTVESIIEESREFGVADLFRMVKNVADQTEELFWGADDK